ncbi:MAG: hypothetical protein EAZ60_20595 [Oscillatoriales cyanobacterium]|nr:MAG: hypothetical protein EAZ60_20595 [Oscillatoriales cyanobacterium]
MIFDILSKADYFRCQIVVLVGQREYFFGVIDVSFEFASLIVIIADFKSRSRFRLLILGGR